MKAGSATKLVLNMISTTVMIRLGKAYENLMVDVRATNDKLTDRAARIIVELTGVSRERAFALLEASGGSLKTGVIMERLKLPRAEAEALLGRHAGSLRAALESGARR